MSEPIIPTPEPDDVREDDFEDQPVTPDIGYARIPGPPYALQPWGIPKLTIFGEDK